MLGFWVVEEIQGSGLEFGLGGSEFRLRGFLEEYRDSGVRVEGLGFQQGLGFIEGLGLVTSLWFRPKVKKVLRACKNIQK